MLLISISPYGVGVTDAPPGQGKQTSRPDIGQIDVMNVTFMHT